MSIRLPVQTVLSYDDVGNVGASSVAGGVAKTFNLPQDTDDVVVKLTASIVGGGVSATFQTSDDGGTTWYDVARSSVVSNANGTNAEWLVAPTIGTGVTVLQSQTAVTGSVIGTTATTGSAAASSLGSRQYSGLPIMGLLNRVFLMYSAGVSANALSKVEVKVNNQAPKA